MTPLAHMGGVPEALSVLVPLALVVVMLRVGAKKMPPDEEAEGAEGAEGAEVAEGTPPDEPDRS